MIRMVVLVLDGLDKSAAVLEAWEEAGVSGITILESTGMGRVRSRMAMRDDAPLMPSLAWLLQHREEQHRTIFTLVESDEMVDRLIQVTQTITGDLDAPNRGILFVLPVLQAVGLAHPPASSGAAELSAAE
ncbi:MAG: P-II family nitrogen regulator [Caldilineaceae bacterium]